jgi:hypothetical protein
LRIIRCRLTLQLQQILRMVINMSVFEELQNGIPYDVRDPKYQEEVHGEIDRCDHICWQIRQTDPADKLKLKDLEDELFNGTQGEGAYLTPPFFIDCASQVNIRAKRIH